MTDPSQELNDSIKKLVEQVQFKSLDSQAFTQVLNNVLKVAEKVKELRQNIDSYISGFNQKLQTNQNEVAQLKTQLEDNNRKLQEKVDEANALNQAINDKNNQISQVYNDGQRQIEAINQQMQNNEAQFRQQLAQAQTDNNNRLSALTQEKQQEIAAMAQQNEALAKQKEEIAAKSAADIQAINQQSASLRGDLERVNQEKDALNTYNQRLIQNITNATIEIKNAVDMLNKNFHMPRNKDQLERAMEEALNSIETISATLQGRRQTGGWTYSRGPSKKSMKGGWTYSTTPSASASSSTSSMYKTKRTTTRRRSALKKNRTRNRDMKSRRKA